jgi:hypothetical protein
VRFMRLLERLIIKRLGEPKANPLMCQKSCSLLCLINPVQTRSCKLRVLRRFMQHSVANYEQIKVIAHEAAECVLRCADDRLTTHIEA